MTEIEDDQLKAIEEEEEPHDSKVEHEAEESFADIAEVLTVTAKKLQSLILGREFTGSKSIEERKKTSTCAACGGDWSRDSQCPKGSKAKSDGKGKSKDGGKSMPKRCTSSRRVHNQPPPGGSACPQLLHLRYIDGS